MLPFLFFYSICQVQTVIFFFLHFLFFFSNAKEKSLPRKLHNEINKLWMKMFSVYERYILFTFFSLFSSPITGKILLCTMYIIKSLNIIKLFNWNGFDFVQCLFHFVSASFDSSSPSFSLSFFSFMMIFKFKRLYRCQTHIQIEMIRLTETKQWCLRPLFWQIEYSAVDMIVVPISNSIFHSSGSVCERVCAWWTTTKIECAHLAYVELILHIISNKGNFSWIVFRKVKFFQKWKCLHRIPINVKIMETDFRRWNFFAEMFMFSFVLF